MNAPIITKDFANKKIRIEKIFAAPRTKVWRAHTDDTILVKWWGPKEWPANSKSFEFREDGHWHYSMTGPDGTQVWGWMDYIEITPEESFSGKDYFCDADGNKDTSMPSSNWRTQFEDHGDTTRIIVELSFETETAMQTIIDMGFEAGFSDALNNLDLLLPTLS